MRFLIIALILCGISLAEANAASFDCAKARSVVEKTICSNSDLSKLDESLSDVYKLALKEHPVKNYVRTRQREWLKENNSCGKDKLVSCLKSNYENRISQLKNISTKKIFSNSEKFEYSSGDAVAEISQENGKFHIYVWGGYRIHRQLSNDAGKEVYTGCEFDGYFTSPSGGKAVGLILGDTKGEFDFKITGNKITYANDTQICDGGFASLPEYLTIIGK